MSATEEQVQVSAEQAAEDAAADFLFGSEPVVEGDEAEPGVVEGVELSEEEEVAAEQIEEELPEMFEFTLGDNTYEVPQELHDELEKAKDYTQKTQGLAREWDTAQVKMTELKAQADQYAFIEASQDEINQGLLLDHSINQYSEYLSANVQKLSVDEVTQLQVKIKAMETERKAIADSLSQKYSDHQQAQEQALEELLNKSTDVLRQKIPNWGDDKDKELRAYALEAGYTETEYDKLVDPRLKETLWKAQQFDRARKGTEAARQTVTSAKKIQTTARNPMPKSTQDKLNLRKKMKSNKRSDHDKGQALGDHIAKRFNM